MNRQNNKYLIKYKTPSYNKNLYIFRCLFSNDSNCHRIYGDFDDKENIN